MKSDNESIKKNSKKMGVEKTEAEKEERPLAFLYCITLPPLTSLAYLAFSGYLLYLHTNKWLLVGLVGVSEPGLTRFHFSILRHATFPL